MKNILITLTIGLSIVVIFNIVKPTPDSSKTQSEWFWAKKTHGNDQHDILLVGDSRTQRGISPEVMHEKMPNKSILNLGYSSLGFSEIVFEFVDTKLKTTDSHPIIVLGITPHSLSTRAISNNHLIQELSRKKTEILLRKNLSPLFRFFESISVLEYVKRITGKGDRYYENFHESGWVESDRYPEDVKRAFQAYRKNLESNDISEDILNKLFDQINLWSGEGIKVYGLRLPTNEDMEQLENELLNFEEEKFKSSFESSGGVWLELDKSLYQTYDGSHLNSSSAKKLSDRLATMLNTEIIEK